MFIWSELDILCSNFRTYLSSSHLLVKAMVTCPCDSRLIPAEDVRVICGITKK